MCLFSLLFVCSLFTCFISGLLNYFFCSLAFRLFFFICFSPFACCLVCLLVCWPVVLFVFFHNSVNYHNFTSERVLSGLILIGLIMENVWI